MGPIAIASTKVDMPLILDPSNPSLPRSAAAALAPAPRDLGDLPEWDLSDLYPGLDSDAFKSDLARAEAECRAIA